MESNIDGTPSLITRRSCYAGDLADVFKIDTTRIANFHKKAMIEKAFVGPLFKEMWNVCMVVMAFAPTLYSARRNVVRALAQTSIADYPSRMEVQIAHTNGVMMNVVFMSDDDIYQLFIDFNVPGVRKQAARLLQQNVSSLHASHAAGNGASTQPAPAAAGDEQAITPERMAQRPDQEVTVNIDGAPTRITQKFYLAGAIADTFKIDTTVLANFDEDAVIEKMILGFESFWNVHGCDGLRARDVFEHRKCQESSYEDEHRRLPQPQGSAEGSQQCEFTQIFVLVILICTVHPRG